jgi:hypothetical protein
MRLETMSSTVPMMGRRQRPMTAATMKSTATIPAIPARIDSPGIVPFTSA